MSLQQLSEYTIVSKYAKYLETEKRRETWEEIVQRSLDMHLRRFSFLPESLQDQIRKAFDFVKNKQVLPSMRSAQFGGDGVERKNERIFNCAFLHIHNTRSIEKAFYLLLCGVGCGFGLGKKWVKQFPPVVSTKNFDTVYTIDDSIEGWAASTKALVDSYLDGNEFTGKNLIFDYSQIRPKGAKISHGGTAPGPEGLKLCHENIKNILRSRSGQLSTLDVYDILMYVADAVLSGGIRRAASIALFDKDDELMLSAKSGDWFSENPQRARSNNSVLLKRDEVSEDDFHAIIEHTRDFGEPGFVFVDDLDTGVNPCAEISFLPFVDGVPAVQMCNLTTINGTQIKNSHDFYRFAWAATVIGTLQAAYTDFAFLDEVDRKVTEEEALLGVSILGYLSNPEILLNEQLLADVAKYCVYVNEVWAELIGINPAARVTCTKPDGNSSCVLESPFSGIHPAHSSYYIRRQQAVQIDPVYKYFKKHNPDFCEPSVYSNTGTDDVMFFPVKAESGILKAHLTAIEHLELVKKVNLSWVKNGEKNNTKPVSHSVSCTILVGPDEWGPVAKYLYENRDFFTTVSLLARTGDTDYAQAPYQAITEEEYNHFVGKFVPVNYKNLHETKDNTKHSEELSCVGGVCAI